MTPSRFLFVTLMPGRARSSAFGSIYRAGGWGDNRPTVSGPGSDAEQTRRIVEEIPALVNELGVSSLLDAPCGDLFWIRECDLGGVDYTGMDIVLELIENNRAEFGETGRRFITADLVTAALPRVDLVLCRDCLVHLRTADILRALGNIKRSGSTYLLTTTFPALAANQDLDQPGAWRRLNLEREPFGFPPPVRLINEGCTEGVDGEYADKSLGLWRLSDLPIRFGDGRVRSRPRAQSGSVRRVLSR